jgi:hypothetical protein
MMNHNNDVELSAVQVSADEDETLFPWALLHGLLPYLVFLTSVKLYAR